MEDEKILEQVETQDSNSTAEKKEYTPRPKWAFDSEYMTERLREVKFLADRGIKHTFVRKTPDYNVSQYKYRKTPALFAALVEFYTRMDVEREYRMKQQNKYASGGLVKKDDVQLVQQDTIISPDVIKQMQETLNKYADQISELQNKIQDDTE